MKYIFLSLLVLNLGYFGFESFGSQYLGALYFSAQVKDAVDVGASQSDPGAPITLLQDASVPASRNAEMNEVVSNPLRLSNNGPKTCLALGPFADVFSGQDALEQLAVLALLVDLKAIDEATGESDYRLLIPPASSADEAFRKLRELKASNIDSYVITKGPQALGISLGVFSTVEAVDALRDRLQALGYVGEIIRIERLTRTYWLFSASDIGIDIGASAWMLERPDLQLRPMSCVES